MPDDSQPLSPTPDGRLSAVSSKRVAIIGASAVVLSAIIAFPTAWVVADYASDTAIENTITQVKAENQRSLDEFLRSQKQAAYARILTDHQNIQRQFRQPVGRESPLAVSELFNTFKRVTPELARMKDDAASVQLVGKRNVKDRTLELIGAHAEVLRAITAYRLASEPTGGSGRSEREKQTAELLKKARADVRIAAVAFTKAARADLGVKD